MLNKFLSIKNTYLTLKNSDNFKKISTNISWLFLDQVLRFIFNAVIGILLAKRVGPVNMGVYGYVLAITSIFTVISSLGLKSIVIKELIEQPNKKDKILGTAFWLISISGFIFWILLFCFFYIWRPYDKLTYLLILILGTSFFLQAAQVISYYYESLTLSKKAVYATSIALLIGNILKIIILKVKGELPYYAIVSFIELALTSALLAYIYYTNKNNPFNWVFDKNIAKKLLKESYPLLFSALAVIIYMKIDQIMIRELSSDHEAGIYAVAIKLTEIWYFIPLIVQSSLMPSLLRCINRKREFYDKMQKVFTTLVLFAYFISITNTFLSDWLINTLFDDRFKDSSQTLTVSIWALVFVCLGVIRNIYFIGNNLIKLGLLFTLIGMVINVGLNIVFIPKYGSLGAAWVTLITQFLTSYLIGFFFKPTQTISKIMTKSLLLKFN